MPKYASYKVIGYLTQATKGRASALVGSFEVDDLFTFLNVHGSSISKVNEYTGKALFNGKFHDVKVDAAWSLNGHHLILESTGAPTIL
jgi:hypothetical protein